MKTQVFLAVFPFTIATSWMITPVLAECQPDRFGNIIDLGDGQCQQFIEEPSPPLSTQSSPTQSSPTQSSPTQSSPTQSPELQHPFPDWLTPFSSSFTLSRFNFVPLDSVVQGASGLYNISSADSRWMALMDTSLIEAGIYQLQVVDCQTGWGYALQGSEPTRNSLTGEEIPHMTLSYQYPLTSKPLFWSTFRDLGNYNYLSESTMSIEDARNFRKLCQALNLSTAF
jgi:hypothetical protein